MYFLEFRLAHAKETLESLEAEGTNDYLAQNVRNEIARIESILSNEREITSLVDSEVYAEI